jgi:multisubunit Na+/H+ antiporter MnhE subunit
MIATIVGLVLCTYMGISYDELSRLILDIIFTGLFMFLFRRFFNRPLEHFLWVSIISMLPYFVWYTFDAAMPVIHRYDSIALLKVVPIATVLILGLDTVFRFMRNRQY